MKIGLISCEIQIVSDKVIHCSVNESLSTSERQLPVTVSASSPQAVLAGQQGSVLQTLCAGELSAQAGLRYHSCPGPLTAACWGAVRAEGWAVCAMPAAPQGFPYRGADAAAAWRDGC